MDIEIDFPRNEFIKELENYIQEGKDLHKKFKLQPINPDNLESLEREFIYWTEEVQEFLKIRLTTIFDNEFLTNFKGTNKLDLKPIVDAFAGEKVDMVKNKYVHTLNQIKKKLDVLNLLKRKTKFIKTVEYYSESPAEFVPLNQKKEMKEIFISHSSLDAKYVEKLIDIFEVIGVPSNKIFCSSFEGYGVRLGNDFLEDIRERLNSNVLVIFVLSENFYSSVVSLCEMGATWVKTNNHIPVLIPPFDYSDVKGVIPTTNGMKINEKVKYNSLKSVIEEFLDLKPINNSVWERKRDNSLKDLKVLLESVSNSTENKEINKTKRTEENLDINFYDNQNDIIKSKSQEEWPDDFEMQLDYIDRHKNAIEKLKKHNPIDIDQDKFKTIRKNGRKEWPDDFEMQLDYEQRQVESLRRLNER
ncbi:toll/interleukin-1 receptor domain-containing protein [Mariniflexile jejuense]|uniref:Toll/interleukin-1 receptor domain-containing protein n=1 Tax=Mariniflexile jejuense TaxID=1173582 RepID=A0ABW3JE11_9FLAO